MSDDVTVRLTEDGPPRIRGNGRTWERGEARTVGPDHAEALVATHDFVEIVDEADETDGPTCAGNGGECSRPVGEDGEYCWQHGG